MRRLTGLVVLLVLLLVAPPAAEAAGLARTQRALARAMAVAGPWSGALAVDLDTGATLYARRPDVARTPASVEKLYTSATALLKLGPDAHLVTSVKAPAPPDATGTLTGDLILQGGGDPTLGPTAMDGIASALAAAGLREVTGRVIGDESAFDAFRGPPSSGLRTSIDVGPLSALSYNHGRTGVRSPYFQSSPPQFAADALTRALRRHGVAVHARARRGVAPPGSATLSEWSSPDLAEVIRRMNQPSDNFFAETLVKDLGARLGGAGSTAAGAAVVRATVAGLGVHPAVVDGSGLSRADRTTPRDVVRLLSAMAADPAVGPAFTASLPVAGRTGTLTWRMRRSAARDRCQGKTGTLRDVSALAGYCRTTAGARVAFAFLMNYVNPSGARLLQDRMTTALASYDPAG